MSGYGILKDMKLINSKRTMGALARIYTHKAEIIADTELFIPLTFTAIRKKYHVSFDILFKSFERWGYDAENLRSDLRSRVHTNKASTSTFKSNADIWATKDSVIERLTKTDSEFFINICKDLGVSPPRMRKVYLSYGLDISLYTKSGGRGKRKLNAIPKKPNSKSLLSTAWV